MGEFRLETAVTGTNAAVDTEHPYGTDVAQNRLADADRPAVRPPRGGRP
ncbi:hypothetical protein [Haloterrigena salinisoli]